MTALAFHCVVARQWLRVILDTLYCVAARPRHLLPVTEYIGYIPEHVTPE